MKKQYIYSALILTAIFSAGCTRELENTFDESSTAIELSSVSTDPMTKAVITGTEFTMEEASAGIGLFLLDGNGSTYPNSKGNVKYTFSSSKWTAESPLRIGEGKGMIYGYYPYSSSVTDIASIPVLSSVDGTDWLYAAPAEVTASTSKSVNLSLSHALARVSLSFKLDESYVGNGVLGEMALSGDCVAASGTLDAIDGSITATKGKFTATDLNLAIGKSAPTTLECLVVPVTNESGTPELSISCTIDGKTYTRTLSGDLAFLAQGRQTTIELIVKNTRIDVDKASINGWDENRTQEVILGGDCKVTIVLADDVTAHDVLTDVYVDGNSVIINAWSKSGEHLKCTLPEGGFYPQSKTSNLAYTFTLADITSSVTAYIGYAKPFTVKISSNNADWGTASASIVGECYEGEKISFKTDTKGICQFVEWQDATGNPVSEKSAFDQVLASDLTLEAVFTAPSGVFSVSSDDGKTTKQIYFSKGNLYYDGTKWGFENNQYDFRTYAGYGSCIDGTYNINGGTPDGNWGLFGWVGESSAKFTGAPEIYGVSTSDMAADYGTNKKESLKSDWGNTINGDIWRTLTPVEWHYLLECRTNARYKFGYGKVNGVAGLFVLPDSFTDPMKNYGNKAFVPGSSPTGWAVNSYSAGNDWEAMEAAGAVFLPSAGSRNGTVVKWVSEYSYYWTATSDEEGGEDGTQAHILYFHSTWFSTANSDPRSKGCCVRLITEVK